VDATSKYASAHACCPSPTEWSPSPTAAGSRPAPSSGRPESGPSTGLPCDGQGRLRCDASLRVLGTHGVWAAGDAAAVPDVTRPGECCAPNAQHAVRQARVLADNLLASLRGEPVTEYRHALKGSLTSLGLHQGAVHLRRVPTLDRKARVLADWVLAGLLKREIVSMGALEQPRAGFETIVERGPHGTGGGG
jgi:NADH dehydrogenase